jgi:hypothetical protein
MHRITVVLLCACSQPKPPPRAPAPAAPTIVAACNTPEHRQFDFWIGDWDVRVRARTAPDKEDWGEAKGTQHIEALLGGCAIAEHFAADGPPAPWAGKSYSAFQPKLGKWRQTWVDDQGSYIALTGGVEAGVMTLYGEPRTANDKTIQMRMVFQNVTKSSLHWEWQRTEDNWATSVAMMTIDYRRR